MGRRLFVGNLPYSVTDDDLNDAFSDSGTVKSARVITDRETGRSRGFGFVEFSTEEAADIAIQNWDGRELGGRSLTVNEAKERSRGNGDRGNGSPRNEGGGGHRGGKRRRGRRDSYDSDW
jgi:RNA recognition motif-containing protein